MRLFKVSCTIRDLIAAQAKLPFRDSGHATPDGEWEFPIDEEVSARLEELRFPGESNDALVERLIAHHKSQIH